MKLQYFVPGLVVVLLGCAQPEPEIEVTKAALDAKARELGTIFVDHGSAGNDGLSVKLTFEGTADLDLYVTGPQFETVYFANHTSKSGGEISDDVRCDTQGERIEEVRFIDPMPGTYRVGIDFPESCDGTKAPAVYALSILHNGEQQQVSGSVSLQRFEVVVLEFEI